MNEFDEMIAGISAEGTSVKPQKADRAEWAERKKQERQEVYDMVDEATALAASEPGMLHGVLDIQSRFDRYSVKNALLVALQCPEARKLGTFEEWQAQGGSICKGEKAIRILVPGKEYPRRDGSTGVSFNVGRVFDISQTTAAPMAVNSVCHDPRRLLEALVRSAPCSFDIRSTLDADAVYSKSDGKILVRQGMKPQELIQAISREIAVATYAQARQGGRDAALDAYCVSYMLCQRFHVPTDSFRFDTVTERLSGMERGAVQNRLKRISKTARDLSDRVRQNLEPGRTHHPRQDGAR